MSGLFEGLALRLTRRFAAPREEVFDGWTDPRVLRRWWAARPSWDSPSTEVDLRVGGRYRLPMRDTDSGAARTVTGEYREIRRPERLACTWSWDDSSGQMRGSHQMLVVDFLDDRDSTNVVLTHRGFADPQIRDLHAHGWQGYLDDLARRVLERVQSPAPE